VVRLEKPLAELEHLAQTNGADDELGWRLKAIVRMIELAAAELDELAGEWRLQRTDQMETLAAAETDETA